MLSFRKGFLHNTSYLKITNINSQKSNGKQVQEIPNLPKNSFKRNLHKKDFIFDICTYITSFYLKYRLKYQNITHNKMGSTAWGVKRNNDVAFSCVTSTCGGWFVSSQHTLEKHKKLLQSSHFVCYCKECFHHLFLIHQTVKINSLSCLRSLV